MKTNISVRFIFAIFIVLFTGQFIAQYKSFPIEPRPYFTKPQPAILKKKLPFPTILPMLKDSVHADSVPLHQEQSIKKIDIRILKRSLYLHRKPFVVGLFENENLKMCV